MRLKAAAFALSVLLLPAAAEAVPVLYRANLDPTNGSGVTGAIDFSLDGTSLSVSLVANNVVAGGHLLHVHGRNSAPGVPVNTFPPPPPVPPNGDANGDGVVTTPEAVAVIGNVLLSLAPHAPGTRAELLPVTSTGTTLTFNATYDLSTNITEPGFTTADLLPLNFRVFDMHGGINPLTGIYDVNLPVAAGKILAVGTTAVPEPASTVMLLAGLAGLAYSRRRSSRA